MPLGQTWIASDPWRQWNTVTSTTGSGTSTVWYDWNQTWLSSTTTSTQVWTQWVAPSNVVQVYSMEDVDRECLRPQRTEAEWAAIRAENERLRQERDRLEAAARAEAHKLLSLVLTREQMASYEARGYFDVVGSHGGVFRVHHGVSGNIRQLLDGQEVNRLCVHPETWDAEGRGHLPTEDVLVGQALALMHDELGTVAKANVHQGVRHLRAVA